MPYAPEPGSGEPAAFESLGGSDGLVRHAVLASGAALELLPARSRECADVLHTHTHHTACSGMTAGTSMDR